jgi:hypothetical protein
MSQLNNNTNTAAACSTAHLGELPHSLETRVDLLTQLVNQFLANTGDQSQRRAEPIAERPTPTTEPIAESKGLEELGTITRHEEPSMLRDPLIYLEAAFDQARKLSKGVKLEASDELWNYWKVQSASKPRDATDQKRLKDLNFILEKLSPLIRLFYRCSLEPVSAGDIIATAEACTACIARYIVDETRVIALCTQYSLDPQKHAKSLREAAKLLPGDHRAQVERAERAMQNERMERAIAGSRSNSGGQYAASRPAYGQSSGRDKANQKRGSHPHPHSNFQFHKNAKAASASEPAARDV